MGTEFKQPFSNAQLELLKMFSRDFSEEDLIRLRNYLAQFFLSTAVNEADKVWEEKKWSVQTMEDFLSSKLRSKRTE